MSQYSSKTNTYIIPFTGFVEIHALTEEEAEKIFLEKDIRKRTLPKQLFYHL